MTSKNMTSKNMTSKNMTSDDILEALAARHTGEGWAFLREVSVGTGLDQSRMDALALSTYPSSGYRRVAYEVKISRSDFRRDITRFADKHAGALRHATEFFYAAPTGLIRPEELPDEAGLIEVNGKIARVKRKAPVRESAPCPSLLAHIARRAERAERYASNERFAALHEALAQIGDIEQRPLRARGPLRRLPPGVIRPEHHGPAGMPWHAGRYGVRDVAQFARVTLRLNAPGLPLTPPLPLIGAGENITCPAGHVLATALRPVPHVLVSDAGEKREWFLDMLAYQTFSGDVPASLPCTCGLDALKTEHGQRYLHVEGEWRPIDGEQPVNGETDEHPPT